jgi:hypothetical protein
MSRILPAAATVAVLVAAGLVYGLRVDRWAVGQEVKDAAGRLERLPKQFGAWSVRPPTEAEQQREADPAHQAQVERADRIARIVGRWQHRLEGPEGKAVSTLLICGRPGPIAAHPPTVCFTAQGYEAVAPPERKKVGDSEFFAVRFERREVGVRDAIMVYWGWADGSGIFRAPTFPATTFAASGALYKLYVTRPTAFGGKEDLPTDPCEEFLTEFVPEFQRCLSAS